MVLIPPSISLTYEFDFIKIKIDPIKINFANKLLLDKFKEKIKSKTMETKDCINNKETKDLNQLLKNIEEALVERLKKAKGEINTKILIKIYLIEYTITKFKIPKEINDFRIPSKEKTSRESPLIEITELSFCISLENVIGE